MSVETVHAVVNGSYEIQARLSHGQRVTVELTILDWDDGLKELAHLHLSREDAMTFGERLCSLALAALTGPARAEEVEP